MRRLFDASKRSTLRLAVTYLAVIMGVSLVYSFFMYQTTARELVLLVHEPNDTTQHMVGVEDGTASLPPDVAPKVPAGHGKATLRHNLILLNTAAFVLGIPVCYLLARRTLRPIEDSIEAQARFSSDAAHELRTPVAALRARNEVALRNPKLTLAEARRVLGDSIEQTVRLETLSEALLQLSHKENHRNSDALQLEDVANEAMNMHVHSASAKRIAIHDEVPDIVVRAYRPDIVQIVSILLDNAIKYSPEGKPVTITGHKDQKWGYVSVIDTGHGIRSTELPHIFERFYRADHARATHTSHSYGLGLSIAEKLARQNGGTLTVRSTPGEGSIFALRLPLAKRV
jgi:signal transduction histidine kinase